MVGAVYSGIRTVSSDADHGNASTLGVGLGQQQGIPMVYDPRKNEFIDGNPPRELAGNHQGGWTEMQTSAAQDPYDKRKYACHLRFRIWVPCKGLSRPECLGIMFHEAVHAVCLKEVMEECLAKFEGDRTKGTPVKEHIKKCEEEAKRRCGHGKEGLGWQATALGYAVQRVAQLLE